MPAALWRGTHIAMVDTEEVVSAQVIKGGIGADQPYWEALGRQEFRLTRCAGCSEWQWPAHYRCGHCGSWDIEWVELEPQGTIYTWSRVFFTSAETKEREEDLPYVAVLVEIAAAAGARVSGVLIGDEDKLRIGAPVRGVFLPPSAKSKNYPTLAWQLI